MFGFLKQKLKDAVSIFTKKADEEAKVVETPKAEILKEIKTKSIISKEPEVKKVEEAVEELKEVTHEKKAEPKKVEQKAEKKAEPKTEKKVEPKKTEQKPIEKKVEPKVKFSKLFNCDKCSAIIGEKEFIQNGWKEVNEGVDITYLCPNCQPKKGFFSKLKDAIVTKKLDESKFDELFWDLELAMLENNVAVEVIEKIKSDMKKALVDHPVTRGKFEEVITDSLKKSINDLFDVETIDIVDRIKAKKDKPFIICFFGVNGSGKTTSIAKLGAFLQKNKLLSIFAAADTFRAAAIQQLEEHANNLAIKMIKHDYGSDSAAVAFDAVKYAQAHQADVVLIDTAGRMHSNSNLMDELKKIIKVVKPDMKIFVGEAITGNDCVDQAKIYNSEIEIDGIILTKADVDDKGGAAISISYVTGKPILFLGMGQTYDDLKPFDKNEIINSLGL
ncbi:MAG: signal recognition particle-docking protein FtsY [Candidatus Woesearchaeota archaeon]